jgi:hypothetical protein
MDLGKYKKAMRPKKYLDGRFVIYDPSLPDASDEQLETRDTFAIGGGVIEGNDLGTREGFYNPDLKTLKNYLTLDKFVELRIKHKDKTNKEFADWLNSQKNKDGTKKYIPDPKQAKEFKPTTIDRRYQEGLKKGLFPEDFDFKGSMKDRIAQAVVTDEERAAYIEYAQEQFKNKPERLKQILKLNKEGLDRQVKERKAYLKKKQKPDYMEKRAEYNRERRKALSSGILGEEARLKYLQDVDDRNRKRYAKRNNLVFYKKHDDAKSILWEDLLRRNHYAKDDGKYFKTENLKHKHPNYVSAEEAQKVVLIDKKGNKLRYDTLFEDIKKMSDIPIEKIIKPYAQKAFLSKEGLLPELKEQYGMVLGQRRHPFHIHHVKGVKVDPFDVMLTFEGQNVSEGAARRMLMSKLNRIVQAEDNTTPGIKNYSKKKKALQTFYNSLGGDIEVQIGKKRVGTATPLNEMLEKTGVKIKPEVLERAGKIDQMEINELLSSFCNVQKRAKGSGSLACGIKEIETNLFKEGRQALKTGVKTPRLAKLGSFMSGLFGAVDIPIELAFAAPHILRGDKDAAKKAMIVGLFGAGRDKVQRANEELGPGSATSRIYRYEKALEDFAGVYTDVVNAQKTLEREDLEKIPQKIQDSALEGLQNGIVRLQEIKKIVDEGTPTVQEISESKAELRDLQATGTFNSDDFTYLGQALSDPLQYPGRLNVGLSGFTGEEGPDRTYTGEDISKPTDFVEAQADEMYPYQKEQDYLSKAVEDAYTGYTGKDILDRYADVKIEDMYKLPQAEQEYAEQGLRKLAMNIGPQAALKIAEEQGLDPSVLSGMFPTGYLERQGFAKGGMSRRDFLKLLGTAFGTIGAAKAGLLKFVGKKATKEVVTTAPISGKPEWFDAVINKVIKEGTDLTKQFATKEREIVHVQKLGEQEGARVVRDLETGEIRLDYDSPTNMGQDTISFTYKPGYVEEDGSKVGPYFQASEAEPRGIRMGPDDYDIEFDGENVVDAIEDLNSDVSTLKQYGTGKLDEKDLKVRKIKNEKVAKINDDQVEQANYLENKYGMTSDDANDYDLNYQDYSDYD